MISIGEAAYESWLEERLHGQAKFVVEAVIASTPPYAELEDQDDWERFGQRGMDGGGTGQAFFNVWRDIRAMGIDSPLATWDDQNPEDRDRWEGFAQRVLDRMNGDDDGD